MNTVVIMLGCCGILTLFAIILIITMVHYGSRTSAISKVLVNHFNGIRTVENLITRLEKKVSDQSDNDEIIKRLDELEKKVDRLSVYVDMDVLYNKK